jgi:hypothetical protein
MIQAKSETGTLYLSCHVTHVRRHPSRSQTQRPVGCESGLGTHISRKDQERAYSKIPKTGARTRSNLQRSVRSLVVNIIRATPWTVRCRGLQENARRAKTVCNRARRRTLQACVLVSEHSVSYIDFPDELKGRAVRLRNGQIRAQLMRITA